MHRQPLLQQLATHQPADATERDMLAQTIAFVVANPDCFHRTLLPGHVTGSAWIVANDTLPGANRQVVLLHHRKLDRWFQPGGHADGDPNIAAVARREAEEETGLTRLTLVSPAIFDVDVHPIPARDHEPAHRHYDIRFLFAADPAEPFVETAETNAVQWIRLADVPTFNDSESIVRLVRKTGEVQLMR